MNRVLKITGYFILIIGALSMIAPFLWMVSVSFMTQGQIFAQQPELIPHPFILSNYSNIFHKIPFTIYFLNSSVVSILTTIFQVLFSAMAGYAFARAKFRYKNALFFLFLVTMMVPPQVNIIPLFFLMRTFNWIDTYQALILPGLFGGFGVFLMRQWFLGMNSEIEDSAKIDGCNFVQTFFRIALPSSLPALVTLSIFTLITTWNSFMWPLIVTNSASITTLPVALAQFKGSFREIIQWGDLMACSVVLSVPVITIFILGKKYFIKDILAGGLKE